MFDTADVDASGGLTFDEFKIFLATASRKANEEHKEALRKGIEVLFFSLIKSPFFSGHFLML